MPRPSGNGGPLSTKIAVTPQGVRAVLPAGRTLEWRDNQFSTLTSLFYRLHLQLHMLGLVFRLAKSLLKRDLAVPSCSGS